MGTKLQYFFKAKRRITCTDYIIKKGFRENSLIVSLFIIYTLHNLCQKQANAFIVENLIFNFIYYFVSTLKYNILECGIYLPLTRNEYNIEPKYSQIKLYNIRITRHNYTLHNFYLTVTHSYTQLTHCKTFTTKLCLTIKTVLFLLYLLTVVFVMSRRQYIATALCPSIFYYNLKILYLYLYLCTILIIHNDR